MYIFKTKAKQIIHIHFVHSLYVCISPTAKYMYSVELKTMFFLPCPYGTIHTVWSEGFLYKVPLPVLKISPIMYFVIHNSVVLSKILKIVVPLEQNFENSIFDSIKLIILIIINIDKQESKWHNDFQYFG